MKWFLPQKVIKPYAPSKIVARPRLVEPVIANLERKLTLMVASAGYGKTMLALELLEQAAYKGCWYELDEHDAHLETFFTYLCESIKQVIPDFLERLPENPGEMSPWELAGLLTATLYSVKEPLLLVLSNFHKVSESQEITDFVDTFITYLPATTHLIILSRNQTHLNLARLVANQEVNLLTQGQLAFELDEAFELARLLGKEDVEVVAEVQERLGGWPAGFALLLGQAATPEQAGNAEELVYDYLESEVLAELSERERRFAYLAALLAPFAERELLSYCLPEDRELLMRFSKERALLFLSGKRAHNEPLYDFQPLVKEFLRTKLAAADPELYRELNVQIGRQRFDAGRYEALENLVNAGAIQEIVARLDVLRYALRASGDYSHFALWLRQLPEEALTDYPELLTLMGEALVQRNPEDAKALYEHALANGVKDPALRAASLSGLLRALHNLRRYQGVLSQAPAILAELRSKAQQRERAYALNSVARAHMSLGDYAQGEAAFKEVQEIGNLLPDPYLKALATRGLAAHADYIGDVQRALLLNQETLGYWEQRGNAVQVASVLNNLASCYYYMGHLHDALSHALRALGMWQDISTETSPVLLHCTLGDIYLALKQYDDALKHYTFAQKRSSADEVAHSYAELALARLYYKIGEGAKAERYQAHAKELAQRNGFKHILGLEALLQGELSGAVGSLKQAEQIFSAMGARRELTQVYWLLAEHAPAADRKRYLEAAEKAEALLGYEARPVGVLAEQRGPVRDAPSLAAAAQREPRLLTVDTPEATAVLDLYTCGHIEIVLNGVPVAINDWNGRKPRDVVLFLASTGVGASRDEVLQALWEDNEGRDPEQQFSVALSRARRTLGWREAIVRDGNHYTFSADLWVQEDAGRIEKLRPGDAVEAMMQALDGYQGDYLPGYYANWVEARRQHLQDHTLVLLSDLLPRLSAAHRHLVPTYAKLALKLDPCHETSYLELIRYHLENRNIEQARRQYASYQEAIADLGLEPNPHMLDVLGSQAVHLNDDAGSGGFSGFTDY